jgi:hypothetical protein
MAAKKKQTAKQYGKANTVKEIEKDLEGSGVKDPKALAASIRRKALGEKEFKLHQDYANAKTPEEKKKIKAKMKVK